MATKKVISYKQKMKDIRPFVDFNYNLRENLSSGAKGKIDKYWRELQEAKGQAYRVYRTKDKKKLKAVQKSTGLSLKGFKVGIIPNYDPENPYSVSFKNDQVILRSKYETKILYPFNKKNLSTNAESEIKNTLERSNAQLFGIQCGKFEYRARAMHRKAAAVTALNLVNAYSGITDTGELANNHYSKWLEGFFSIEVTNQKMHDAAIKKKKKYRHANPKKRKELLNQHKKGYEKIVKKELAKHDKKNSNGRLRD